MTALADRCDECGADVPGTDTGLCHACADALWNTPCGLDCGNDLEDTEPPTVDGVLVCASCHDRHVNGPDDDPDAWAGGFAENH